MSSRRAAHTAHPPHPLDRRGVRVATFNVENLFFRYDFTKAASPVDRDGFSINDLAFQITDETSKQLTAAAIRAVDANIIALQEVENLELLDRFTNHHLKGLGYNYRLLIDSHDPRHIDVAVLSRHPFGAIHTHRHERGMDGAPLFSRDCLEVEVVVNRKVLHLFINHFKSMVGGREQTHERRLHQAERVAALVDEQWQKKKYDGNFVVLGDLNDYPGDGTALEPLLKHHGLVNVLERLPAEQRWTHYYAKENEYRQLDYLLVGKALAKANPTPPKVMRQGLPLRADRVTEARLPGVGHDHPKASDHAPLYMDLELL